MATQNEQSENGGDPDAPSATSVRQEQLAAAMASVAAAHQRAEDAVTAASEGMSGGVEPKAEVRID